MKKILEQIEEYLDFTVEQCHQNKEKILPIFEQFLMALESGEIRSAYPENGIWHVEARVKKGILLGFRLGHIVNYGSAENLSFTDKSTYPARTFTVEDKIRIVPGGCSVRRGAYMAAGTTMMPPAYVNVGAYVDQGTMIDSHALVGSCAQIGKNVHLSAAAQIGGVLEPIGAKPVIVEDHVMIGGNCGVYEGTWIKKNAVLGSGVILTKSTKVYDLVHETIIKAEKDGVLTIPEGAVLIPGNRQIKGSFAEQHGLSISSPLIVKYRDAQTNAKTELESSLREI